MNMDVFKFEKFLNDTDMEFNELLNDILEGNSKDRVLKFLNDKLSHCTSVDEEIILKERLEEVYKNHIGM